MGTIRTYCDLSTGVGCFHPETHCLIMHLGTCNRVDGCKSYMIWSEIWPERKRYSSKITDGCEQNEWCLIYVTMMMMMLLLLSFCQPPCIHNLHTDTNMSVFCPWATGTGMLTGDDTGCRNSLPFSYTPLEDTPSVKFIREHHLHLLCLAFCPQKHTFVLFIIVWTIMRQNLSSQLV